MKQSGILSSEVSYNWWLWCWVKKGIDHVTYISPISLASSALTTRLRMRFE